MDSCLAVSGAKQALERVVGSRSFARANQLRRLLSYLVETALAGREATLKESVIGVDVFDLPADFDPKIDPVVRMGMRRLRSRLQQYYENDGARDPILIALEPGHYAPKFLPRGNREPQRISLVVLPFDACSKADREISGVLREGVLTRLAENPSLYLVANESVASDAQALDTATLARTTMAAFILRGCCATDGETIQVSTELVSCEGNQRLWLGTHEQVASADVWLVQNDIASEVEKRVFAKTGEHKECAAIVAGPEQGLYRLILQGRFYLQQNNPESLTKSAQCFHAAVEQQPASALAWAGLSVAQIWMVMYHMAPAELGWRTASLAADRAVSLDPGLPESQLALALLVTLGRFRPVEAGIHFERALASNPGDNSVRISYAMTHLAALGRLEEAEDQLESVLANDPLNLKALQMMALVAYFGRRYEDAAELALSALDLLPRSIVASFTLANCHERMGQEEKALQQYRKCEELFPVAKLLKLSSVVAAVYKGRTKWVRPTVLAAAKVLQASSRAPAAMISDLLIRLGETERAVQWMERAFSDKAFRALFLGVDPSFDAIRNDPRCVRLLAQLHTASGNVTEG